MRRVITMMMVALGTGGAMAAGSWGQQPIRVDVNLVNVAFTARDSHGALVNGLTKDDVELSEDGVPQKIEFLPRAWMCR